MEKLSKFGEVMTPFVADKTITHLGSEHPTGIGLVFVENGFIRIFFVGGKMLEMFLQRGLFVVMKHGLKKYFHIS